MSGRVPHCRGTPTSPESFRNSPSQSLQSNRHLLAAPQSPALDVPPFALLLHRSSSAKSANKQSTKYRRSQPPSSRIIELSPRRHRSPPASRRASYHFSVPYNALCKLVE